MANWGKMRKIERKSTGIFCKSLVGLTQGQIGEIVYYHSWGGIDLEFEDGSIATFANDDVENQED